MARPEREGLPALEPVGAIVLERLQERPAAILVDVRAGEELARLLDPVRDRQVRQDPERRAWEHCREGMPWAIMTFAVAYTVALLADDEDKDFAFLGRAGRHLCWWRDW